MTVSIAVCTIRLAMVVIDALDSECRATHLTYPSFLLGKGISSIIPYVVF